MDALQNGFETKIQKKLEYIIKNQYIQKGEKMGEKLVKFLNETDGKMNENKMDNVKMDKMI